jgi:hypothetical protein
MTHYVSDDEFLRELEAMSVIEQVLETLEQPAARHRVLRWAAEKFQLADIASVPVPSAIGAPVVVAPEVQEDEPLDGFEEPASAAEQVRGEEPLDALVRELAADFQRLALKWHGA